MFKIAICDDEKTVCSEIESIIIKYKSQCVAELDVEVFYSGEELCGFVSQGNYFDLIFLDIEMQLLNGVEVGLKLRHEMDNQTTQIVYVSCRESYYRELFEVRPLNFINKPVTSSKIIEEIEKALSLAGKLQGVFNKLLCGIMAAVGAVIIFALAPVEDANKPLDKIERKVYRKRACLTLAFWMMALLFGGV